MEFVEREAQVIMDRLIEVKLQAQALEEEAKALQAQLLTHYPDVSKYSNYDGTLTRVEKPQYTTPSNADFIQAAGQDLFNKTAKLSVSDIKKVGGEQLLTQLLAVPGTSFVVKAPSVYFMFKASK